MEDPKLRVEIKHSESKSAWNIIGTKLGSKYKVARIPYVVIVGNKTLARNEKDEAFKIAKYLCFCFNNSKEILSMKNDFITL